MLFLGDFMDKFYGDMLDLFSQTNEYKRYLAMGLDIISLSYDGPEVYVFFEVPHKSIYYKRYRVYAVEFYFGRHLERLTDKLQVINPVPYVVHIDLAGLNRLLMLTDDKNCKIVIESNEFPELLSERAKSLNYRYDIILNTDLSGVNFYSPDKTIIKSYENLMTYIDFNAKINFTELVFNIDFIRDSNVVLYNYLDYFSSSRDELIDVFGDKLYSKKACMNITIDLLFQDYFWSIKHIRRLKDYLDCMLKELILIDKKDRILNYIKLSFCYYNSSSIVCDDSDNLLSDNAYRRVFRNLIDEKFNDLYILDFYAKTGIRLDVKKFF